MAAEARSDRGDPAETDKSVGELVIAIKNDMTDLIRGQIELAKAELRDEVKSASMGAAAIAVAIVLVALAVVLLSIALVIVINNTGITLGWSFAIVAGGYLLLAGVLGFAARSGFKKVVGPRRARASIEKTRRALRPTARS